MKLNKDKLRSMGIYNSHNLCSIGGGRVYVCYSANSGYHPSHWSVVGVREQTDPGAPWYDYGMKSFSGKLRDGTGDEAMRWATEKYGISQWVKDPFGAYQCPEVMESVQRLLSGKQVEVA